MIEIIDSNRLLGIAKKLNAEMEALPLVAHGAVIGFLNTLANHREMAERQLNEAKAAEVGERQQALMLAEQARQAEAQRQRINQRAARVFTTGEADHKPALDIVDPKLREQEEAEVLPVP
jgi:sRNA-binding protein